MAEKAKESKKNDKTGLITGICATIAVAIVIIITVIIVINTNRKLTESYFVSDDSKYVLTFGSEDMIENEDGTKPEKVHVVYNYSGDKITGITSYYLYPNKETAEKAFKTYNDAKEDRFKDVSLDGNYVIIASLDSDYENLTTEDIKQYLEAMQNTNSEGTTSEEVIETTETTEGAEETPTAPTTE